MLFWNWNEILELTCDIVPGTKEEFLGVSSSVLQSAMLHSRCRLQCTAPANWKIISRALPTPFSPQSGLRLEVAPPNYLTLLWFGDKLTFWFKIDWFNPFISTIMTKVFYATPVRECFKKKLEKAFAKYWLSLDIESMLRSYAKIFRCASIS